ETVLAREQRAELARRPCRRLPADLRDARALPIEGGRFLHHGGGTESGRECTPTRHGRGYVRCRVDVGRAEERAHPEDLMDQSFDRARNSREYFGGWPGHDHLRYSGDYHVDGEQHLPLEILAQYVAKEQAKRAK